MILKLNFVSIYGNFTTYYLMLRIVFTDSGILIKYQRQLNSFSVGAMLVIKEVN